MQFTTTAESFQLRYEANGKLDETANFIEPKETATGNSVDKAISALRARNKSGDRTKQPRFDLANNTTETALSQYSFIPPFTQFYHNIGTQKLDPIVDCKTEKARYHSSLSHSSFV